MAILGYSVLDLALFLGLAAVVGVLAQALAGYTTSGCLLALVLGFVGAWLGAWVAETLALPPVYAIEWNGQLLPLIWPAVGALLFAFFLNLLLQRFLIDV